MPPCADVDDERVLTWTNKPVEFPVPKISFGVAEADELYTALVLWGMGSPMYDGLEEALSAFLIEHSPAWRD